MLKLLSERQCCWFGISRLIRASPLARCVFANMMVGTMRSCAVSVVLISWGRAPMVRTTLTYDAN